ncbi:MAG: gliding motility-associated C-terminal domain-containing protein [Bacteroidales bacterium]
MKSQPIHTLRRIALLAMALSLAVAARPQAGSYYVQVLNPLTDTLRVCPGQGIFFRAECHNTDGAPFNDAKVDFTWSLGYQGIEIKGSSFTHAFPAGGHYRVKLTVKGLEGPDATNSPEIHVFVSLRPYFTGTRSDNSSLCSGNQLALTGFITPVPWAGDDYPFVNQHNPSDFAWEGLGIVSDRDGVARIDPPLDLGHLPYLFRVKDDFGCFYDTTLTLYGVKAEFTMEPKTGEAPLEVKFEVKDPSNGGFESSISYQFEFYEQQDTNKKLTTNDRLFVFDNPGVYISRMTAKYDQCTFRFTPPEEYIRVDSSLLEIPNVFTPNGDGFNDFFQVKALSLRTFKGLIFNRWGRVLYEWDDPRDPEKGWNGKDQNTGREVPVGTYFYVITASGYDKDRTRTNKEGGYPDIEYRGGVYKGSFMLFR